MHLVYRALEKDPVPQILPAELVPASKRKRAGSLVGGVPVLPDLAAVGRSSPVMARTASPIMGVCCYFVFIISHEI